MDHCLKSIALPLTPALPMAFGTKYLPDCPINQPLFNRRLAPPSGRHSASCAHPLSVQAMMHADERLRSDAWLAELA